IVPISTINIAFQMKLTSTLSPLPNSMRKITLIIHANYHLECGGKTIDTPFLAVSITNLFTPTYLFMLQEQGKLTCENKLTTYLGNHILDQQGHLTFTIQRKKYFPSVMLTKQ